LASSRTLATLAGSLAGLVLLGGCASIFEGTTQQISVTTTPAGARCTFWRSGALISDIASTPGAVTIRKTREDLTIVCDKRGYATATYINRSGVAMSTFANILTAGLAWAVDSTRGADNKYEGSVSLALAPAPAGMMPVTPIEPEPAAAPEASPPEPATSLPRTGRPPPPMPAAAPAAPPPGGQLTCAAADGSRIRVTGSACPAGWTVAR
jgi:hypothetical protein